MMVTMGNVKKVPVLIFVGLLVLVNLSNGFAIKEPGSYTASFSGSSSSASAFSHASSSSYSFNGGAINPQDLAVAAKASAVAGTGINGQAVAGATAGSAAGSLAGSYDHSDGANLAQSGQSSGAVSSSGAFSSGSEISGLSKPIDTGSYKVIESPKYSTGYSGNGGNAKTNYAVSGNYAQQTAGGCQTCKQTAPAIVPLPLTPTSVHHTSSSSGTKSTSYHSAGYQHISPSLIATFPGPSGSILDSKPATAHANANSGSYNNVATGIQKHVVPIPVAGIQKHVGLHEIIAVLPGPSGSIYDSKPANGQGSSSYNGAGSTYNNHQVGSTNINHSGSVPCGSPNKNCGASSGGIHPSGSVANAGAVAGSYNVPVVGPSSLGPNHVFPGPSGSIHDSKPAGTVPGSSANAGSTSTSYNIPASHPVVGPVCSYTPGSPNKCGSSADAGAGSTYNIPASHPVVAPGPSHVFPGPSGSIHDSKPAGAVSGSSANAGAIAGSTSTSYNIPASHPVVAPGPNHVFPGPSGSIHDSKPAGTVSGSSANAGAIAGSTSTSYDIPASHPVAGPVCSYTPGSPNKCGSTSNNIPVSHPVVAPTPSGHNHVFPGPSGSIHDSQPAGAVSGSSANAGSTSTSYDIPASHPVAGPICSYTPGSPNKCGSSANAGAGSTYNIPASHPVVVAPTPSGHNHLFPGPSGSIHDSKPAVAVSGSSANAGAIAGSTSTSYNVPASHPVAGTGSTSTSYNIPASHPVAGPVCSYTPGSPNKCGSSGSDSSSGAGSITYNPYSAQTSQTASNSGTYYIDKPSVDIQPPLSSAAPSFSGQIPCKDNNCGSSSDVVYDDKDRTGQYQQINHDQAHLSGGIVYQNEDGSYSSNPATSKPVYKNADHGGYAVSNSEDHAGILIGPGTGSLPVEPFGSAPGGSETFAKEKNTPFGFAAGGSHAKSGSETFAKNTEDKNVPFGFAVGGSHAQSGSDVKNGLGGSETLVEDKNVPFGFAAGGSHAQSGSETFTKNTEDKNVAFGFAAGGSHAQSVENVPSGSGHLGNGVIIQKSDGVAIPQTPSCSSSGNCGYNNQNGCSGSSCGSDAGFATGQVLINQGNSAYDATNSGSNEIASKNYGHSHHSGQGLAFGVSSGGLLKTLFGHGGLSGYHKSGSAGFGGGSAAFSSAGSYASAGSFAGASAHSGSFARSF